MQPSMPLSRRATAPPMRRLVLLAVSAFFGATGRTALRLAPADRRCEFARCLWAFGEAQAELLDARRGDRGLFAVPAGTSLEEEGGDRVPVSGCHVPCSVTRRFPRAEVRSEARRGVLFIGDSTIRRIYVRAIARLEGLSDHQSEVLQDSAKAWKHDPENHAAVLDRLRDNGEPVIEYHDFHGPLPTYIGFRFASNLNHSPEIVSWVSEHRADRYGTVVVGVPLAHMLYHPRWKHSPLCVAGPAKFAAHLRLETRALLQALRSAEPGRRLILMGGFAYSHDKTPQELLQQALSTCEMCMYDKCIEWTQTNDGVRRANTILAEVAAAEGVAYVDLFRSSVDQVEHSIDKLVHYKYPVLDDQLAQIFAAFEPV